MWRCVRRSRLRTASTLAAIPNFGKKSIDEVVETLHARGLDLRDD